MSAELEGPGIGDCGTWLGGGKAGLVEGRPTSGRTMTTSEWRTEVTPGRETYTRSGLDTPAAMAPGTWRIHLSAGDGAELGRTFVVETDDGHATASVE